MSAAAISSETPMRDRGKLLRKFRKQYGIKLVKFGKLCKVSQPMLTQFERGDHNLSDEAWDRVLAAMTKLLAEAADKRKAELAKAEQTAAQMGAFTSLFGVNMQSPEYRRAVEAGARRLAEAEGLTLSEYLRREAEAINPAAVGEHKIQDEITKAINERVIESGPQVFEYVKKVEGERDVLLAAYEQMGDWLGKLEKNLLSAQKLNREEIAGLVKGLQQARERLLAIRAKVVSG